MKSSIFAVGDEPYCLWEDDVGERTRDFLAGLDVEFFTYVLQAHLDAEDENAHRLQFVSLCTTAPRRCFHF